MDKQAKLRQLATLCQQVADDYGLRVAVGRDRTRLGGADLNIGDGSLLLWVTFDDEHDPDKITDLLSLATYKGLGDIELDHLHELTYNEFLDMVADTGIEPPEKDYGLDLQNTIAWHLHAYKQSGRDLQNLYSAGYYKVRGTVARAGESTRTGLWVHATSSEDARQQFIDAAQGSARDLKIESFSEEKPDLGIDGIADAID